MNKKFLKCFFIITLFLFDFICCSCQSNEINLSNRNYTTVTTTVSTINLLERKILQLENIINAHSHLLAQIQKQLIDYQFDIDFLRGQVQENQHNITKISQQLNKKHQEESSINILNKASPTLVPSNFTRQLYTLPSNDKNLVFSKSLTIANDFTNIKKNKDNVFYNKAISLMLKKKYNRAINLFKKFIKFYPDSIFQANANYWLGQLYYNQEKKDIAFDFFITVIKKYPKSPKASDALFKIGIIMQEKGKKKEAKIIYRQIGKIYPKTNTAKQAYKRLTSL